MSGDSKHSASFDSLGQQVYDVYCELLGGEIPSEVTGTEMEARLSVIETFREKGPDLSREELMEFLPLMMDASGAVAASGGDTQTLELDDIDVFDPVRERRGELLEDSNMNNWFFSTLIQGWFRNQTGQELEDLKNHEETNTDDGQVCDFKLEREDGGTDLLECTRLNRIHSLEDLSDKIYRRTNWKAAPQITGAAEQLDIDSPTKHFIIDISNCTERQWTYNHEHRDIQVHGYDEDDIDSLERRIRNEPNMDCVDRITLCWTNTVFVDETPRVVLTPTRPINLTDEGEDAEAYGGWTIEGFKLPGRSGILSHLQIYSQPEPMENIHATIDAFDQRFFSQQPAQPTGD